MRNSEAKMKYSAISLFANALSGHKKWPVQFPDKEPKKSYDAIIVGGGGHGLGAAYYLAKRYGITNVAVLEKGWIGGGNTGRNTTIIRSNYLFDESAAMYDHAVDLWDGLGQELNYNLMFSKRGVLMLAHNVHDVQSLESYPLQALVSEPIKPVMPCVVMSNAVHAYISQSDKGELVIGAGTDQYTSYSQRGALHLQEHNLVSLVGA